MSAAQWDLGGLRSFESGVQFRAESWWDPDLEHAPVAGGGGTTYFQNVSGSLTPTGSLIKQTNKVLAGGLTPAGSLFKQTSKTLTGGVTPAGALFKQTNKTFTGGLTPSGTLVKQTNKVLAGGLTPSGTLVRQTEKALGGTVTPTGTLVKQTQKTLTGGVTPTGQLFASIVFVKLLSGVLTFAGSLSTLFVPGGPVARVWRKIRIVIDRGI